MASFLMPTFIFRRLENFQENLRFCSGMTYLWTKECHRKSFCKYIVIYILSSKGRGYFGSVKILENLPIL